MYPKYSGLVAATYTAVVVARSTSKGRTAMFSEPVCHVARSWVNVVSFHTRLVVRFMIFTESVRNILDTPSYKVETNRYGRKTSVGVVCFVGLNSVFVRQENLTRGSHNCSCGTTTMEVTRHRTRIGTSQPRILAVLRENHLNPYRFRRIEN
jgi:hypothetical protein